LSRLFLKALYWGHCTGRIQVAYSTHHKYHKQGATKLLNKGAVEQLIILIVLTHAISYFIVH